MTHRRLSVDAAGVGARADRWLASQIPGLSRARLQILIDQGNVRIDGTVRKASYRLREGELVDVDVPPPVDEELIPEPIALDVIHEDEHVLVLDKPAGMVVHPGAGQVSGTLAAAVLAHAPQIAGVGGPRRPGVVHRLDRGTSGLLVIAKTPLAYTSLTAQLATRTVKRVYLAVVHGRLAPTAGVVDAPIGRDPYHRARMAVVSPGRGKRAVTRYRVRERFPEFTFVEATLETGRTHQIRVHLGSLGHPVAGDQTYGGSSARRLPVPIQGHALHAARLAFSHPVTGEAVAFESPLPSRIERLLDALRNTGAPRGTSSSRGTGTPT